MLPSGSETSRAGLAMLFEMLQFPSLNKRLVIVILEGVIKTVFPEQDFNSIFLKLHSRSSRYALGNQSCINFLNPGSVMIWRTPIELLWTSGDTKSNGIIQRWHLCGSTLTILWYGVLAFDRCREQSDDKFKISYNVTFYPLYSPKVWALVSPGPPVVSVPALLLVISDSLLQWSSYFCSTLIKT